MPVQPDEVVLRALRATQFDACDSLFWRVDAGVLSVYVRCNDVFIPSSDVEPVNADSIDALEQAVADAMSVHENCQSMGPLLFVARQRKAKLRGHFTVDMGPELRALFDAAVTP